MNLHAHPIAEINNKAIQILFQQMGIVDTLRFLNQFTLGNGDYTKDRQKWLGTLTLDDILSEIKANRTK